MKNNKATRWFATPRFKKAETAVWWDMDACPVPEGCDARDVGPCIDRTLQNLGYSGPLSITAFSKNLKHTPDSVVQALSSTGIVMKQDHDPGEEIINTLFFWGNYNIVVISHCTTWMYPTLSKLYKQGYNIFIAYPNPLPSPPSGWHWETLVKDALSSAIKKPLPRRKLRQEEPAPFFCTLCDDESFQNHSDFTTHLRGKEHELNEYLLGIDLEFQERNVATIMMKRLKSQLKNVVVKPGVIDSSQPEHKAMVWWDIDSCELPPDYNACDVGPRIESKFKNIGFSGTLKITAIGTADAPDLGAIASSGINVKCVQFGCASIIDDVLTWATLNPPPAKIMIISTGTLLERMSPALVSLEKAGYNILLAHPDTLPKNASRIKRYHSSSWETLLQGEKKSSDDEPEARVEMGRDASIICSTCNLSYQTFDSFVHHFDSEDHKIQAFRTCYYYLNQEPGSGTRYSLAVKPLSKDGLHTCWNYESFIKPARRRNKNKLQKMKKQSKEEASEEEEDVVTERSTTKEKKDTSQPKGDWACGFVLRRLMGYE